MNDKCSCLGSKPGDECSIGLQEYPPSCITLNLKLFHSDKPEAISVSVFNFCFLPLSHTHLFFVGAYLVVQCATASPPY